MWHVLKQQGASIFKKAKGKTNSAHNIEKHLVNSIVIVLKQYHKMGWLGLLGWLRPKLKNYI